MAARGKVFKTKNTHNSFPQGFRETRATPPHRTGASTEEGTGWPQQNASKAGQEDQGDLQAIAVREAETKVYCRNCPNAPPNPNDPFARHRSPVVPACDSCDFKWVQEWWPEQLTGKCHRCFCVDRKGIPQPLLQDLRGFEQWRLAFQRKHAWNGEDPLRIAHCEFEMVIKAKFVDVWEMPNLPHDRWPWSRVEVARMVSLDPGWDESWGWRPEYEVAKWERVADLLPETLRGSRTATMMVWLYTLELIEFVYLMRRTGSVQHRGWGDSYDLEDWSDDDVWVDDPDVGLDEDFY